jgi:hypothetical protein
MFLGHDTFIYLSDRNKKCQLGDLLSTVRRVTCGIPQRSILRLLLKFFLVYINDLPQCLNRATPRLFADDTNLTVSGERAYSGIKLS